MLGAGPGRLFARIHLPLLTHINGAWFGSITPPEPTRIRRVAAAMAPIMISGAPLATEARL